MPLLSILLILCVGTVAYSNSFHVPFQFDDKIFIVDNLAIRQLSDLQRIWNFMPCRFITFLSLALNFHVGGLDVFGYHLVNLLAHLLSAIFVWWLTLLTLSSPALKQNKITQHAKLISLFAGLIFVSHPIQTEAVTYIWQRTESMAGLFYLASLCFYIKSRLDGPRKLYYTCSLMMAILAMHTKETAITLPLIIVLYEYCFLNTKKNLDWKRLTPFLLTILIIPLTILFTSSANAQRAPTEPSGISPMHYLLTQFRVMLTYIRLVLLPLNQDLDYDYPVFKNIFEWPVLISILSLMAIFYGTIRLFSKYRIVSFSILWFFLTLLPESSFLPLKDVIFEHRLYLPMAGFSIFLVSSVYYLWGDKNIKTMMKVFIVLIGCYSILTYQRNKIWKDEFTLWDNTARKSPHKERTLNNFGLVLAQQGNLTYAIAEFTKAIEINPQYTNAFINRGFIYNKMGNFTQAVSDYDQAIKINPRLAEAYIDRGNVFDKQGGFTKALSDFNKAIEINPGFVEGYTDRGNCYLKLNNFTQAIADYNKAILLKPDYADAYYNLGFIYYKQGNLAQAFINFNKAAELNPNDRQAIYNRDVINRKMDSRFRGNDKR